MYKIINGKLHKANDNDKITIDGVEMVFCNLEKLLETNPAIAQENDYYPLAEVEKPEHDEATQYLSATYAVVNDEIVATYSIETLPTEEGGEADV